MRKLMLVIFLTICHATFAFDATIPVLDLNDYNNEARRPLFVESLRTAMAEVGFFALVNTGVDSKMLDSAYDELRTFFAHPFEMKNTINGAKYNFQRGFAPGESAKGEGSRVDFKQFLHIGYEENCPNIWPQSNPL